jgi:hypothetical protein
VYRAWRMWARVCAAAQVLTNDGYGVGIRLRRETLPHSLRTGGAQLSAQPGDLYLFNHEFVHDTPEIAGEIGRTVVQAIVAYSKDSEDVEVYV